MYYHGKYALLNSQICVYALIYFLQRKLTYFRAAGAERCIICAQSQLFSASPSPLPHLFIYWACAVLVLLWWQASSTVKVDDRTPKCAVPPSILPINVAIDEGMRTRMSTSRQRHDVSGTPDDYSPHRHYCDPLLVIQAHCGKTRDQTVDKLQTVPSCCPQRHS